MKYVAPYRRTSGRNPDAENRRRSAIVAPAVTAVVTLAMSALPWNSGIDSYRTLSRSTSNILIVVSPAPARRPELQTTAFGALVEPDVKSSSSRASGAGSGDGNGAPSYSPNRALYAPDPTVSIASGGMPRSSPASVSAPASSDTTSWQSVWRTSCASSAPRRVGLMPTTAAPASAAPPIQYRYSGTFSSSTPTWNGPSRRASRNSAARRAASAMNARYEIVSSSKRIAV